MSVKAILIQLPEDLYKKIKVKAVNDGKSLKQIYIELTLLYLNQGKEINENGKQD